jgi:2-polyprenyl-3-methyl-5-hydroxy-6-metoxy-1,4-benzoquinol methylase
VAEPGSRIETLIARLERERAAADRRYNETLTAVDQAIQSTTTAAAAAPPDYDTTRLGDLNASWDLLPVDPRPSASADRSLKGRLRAFVWRLVAPPLETQKQFNAALVDHLNRNAQAHRERADALARLIESSRRELDGLVRFQSLLVQFLQTITLYVDSRDRAVGGSEIRERVALNEQRLLALRQLVEHAGDVGQPTAASVPSGAPAAAFTGSIDSLTYVAFEDRFRGAEAEIECRIEDYLPLLAQAADVVDIGCGRGELLGALAVRGISAIGVDASPAMVEICRSKGFAAEQGDALAYLARQPPTTIGGLVAIQVVEHFTPAYLTRFLDAAFRAMRPGAPLILETINPACWMAFFETYIRDITHQQPLHPDTLRYLVQASGFRQVDVQFRQPVRESDRLDRILKAGGDHPELRTLTAAINAHADKLNARLFSSMDYVVISRR